MARFPMRWPTWLTARQTPESRIRGGGESIELTGRVELIGAASEEDRPPLVRLRAYTGGPMRVSGLYHPVIVDLSGARFAQKTTPVIMDHDTSQRIGHTTEQSVDREIAASAVVSSESDIARGFVADARAGFPFQVSIGASVDRRELLREGAAATVNGQRVQGPMWIARKTKIKELSVTVLGADPQTAATVAAQATEDHSMNFEDFVASLGFQLEALTDRQRDALKAQYEQSQARDTGDDDPDGQAPKKKTPNSFAAGRTPDDPAPSDGDADPAAQGLYARLEARAQARFEDETLRREDIRDLVADAPEHLTEVEFQGKTMTLKAMQRRAIRDSTVRPADVELAILRATAGAPIDGRTHPVAPSMAETAPKAIEASLCRQFGLGDDQVLQSMFDERTLEAADRPEFRDITLHALMDQTIHAASGTPWRGGRKNNGYVEAFLRADRDLRASGSFSSYTASGILGNTANKLLKSAYDATEVVWPQIASVENLNDFKSHSMYRLTALGNYGELGADGELKHGSLKESEYTVQADTHGMIIALTRKHMINDDLGAFLQIPRQFGRLANLAIELSLLEMVLANSSDFFASGNSNLISGSSSDFDIAGLTAAETKFRNQVDGAGKPILATPDRVLVGTQDATLAGNIYNSPVTDWLQASSGGSKSQQPKRNPHTGKFRPLSTPVISNSNVTKMNGEALSNQDTDQWYMFCNPSVFAALHVGFVGGRRVPVIESAETDFDTLGMQWRSYLDFGTGYGDSKAAVKSAGT